MDRLISIGELAELKAVSVETIRITHKDRLLRFGAILCRNKERLERSL